MAHGPAVLTPTSAAEAVEVARALAELREFYTPIG